MSRILIIRTEPAASEMVARLNKFGWEASALPLLRVRPLTLALADEKRLQERGYFDVVVVVSAHAARLFLQIGHAAVGGCWLAIGRATEAPLAAAGITCRIPDQPLGSEALLALPELSAARIAGRRVLLLQGDNARPLLADTLHERGARLEKISLYVREENPLPKNIIQEALDTPWSLVVVGSGELLQTLATHRNLISHRWPLLVPSPRVAALAIASGFNQVATLADSDLDATAVHHWLNHSAHPNALC